MTKITIEIGGSDSTITGVSGVSTSAQADTGKADHNTRGASANLLAEAAAIGALNAGPAPSFTGEVGAPVASSIGGATAESQPLSGGAAADHVFGTPR